MVACPSCGRPQRLRHTCVPASTLVVRDRGGREPQGAELLLAPDCTVGSYRIISLIGEGAVGRVYLAEHTKIGRRVALKMLRSEFSRSRKAVTRFFSEARAVNQIAHENIVTITDFVEDGDHPAYYIMDLLSGSTLAEMIDGPLPIELVVDIAAQLSSALGAVHDQKIVHRDLKPANIFVCAHDQKKHFVRLLDFGVAQLSDESEGGQTSPGDLVGTPLYMSPEQSVGERVDARSDLYALGVILYEMVTGQPPFSGGGLLEILLAHRKTIPIAPSQVKGLRRKVPAALEALIQQCLSKNPENRPASAREVEARLRKIGRELEAHRGRGKSRRTGIVVAAGAAIALAGLAFLSPDRVALRGDPIVAPERPLAESLAGAEPARPPIEEATHTIVETGATTALSMAPDQVLAAAASPNPAPTEIADASPETLKKKKAARRSSRMRRRAPSRSSPGGPGPAQAIEAEKTLNPF